MRLAALLLLLLPAFAGAATFDIWSNNTFGSSTPYDCATNGVGPGDTIYLHNHTSGAYDHSRTGSYTGVSRTGKLGFQNCQGTEAAPIIIRNHPDDNGPLRIDATENSAFIRYYENDWVTLDGTGGWWGMDADAYCGVHPTTKVGAGTNGCGIVLRPQSTTAKPTSYINMGEFETSEGTRVAALGCTDNTGEDGDAADSDGCYPGAIGLVVKGVEIDGTLSLPTGGLTGAPFSASETGRVGLYCHTALSTSPGLAVYPQAWREQFVITQNYIHHVFGEAIYCGNNTPFECDCGALSNAACEATGFGGEVGGSSEGKSICPRLRDVEISYNLVQHTGRDSINLKQLVEGDNRLHNNHIYDTGFRKEDWELPAMPLQSSSVDVYDNLIVRPGGVGIAMNSRAESISGQFDAFEPFEYNVYNNIIVEAGTWDLTYSMCEIDGECLPVTGTVPDSDDEAAINTSAAESSETTVSVYNNTVVDSDGHGVRLTGMNNPTLRNNIIVQGNVNYISITGATGTTTNTDNLTGAVTLAEFVDEGNGDYRLQEDSPAIGTADTMPFSAADIIGTSRPQGDEADAGAYEYIYPIPPSPLSPVRVFRGIQQ